MNIYILVGNVVMLPNVTCLSVLTFVHSFFNEISFATTGIPGLLEANYDVDFCRLEASLACLGNLMNEQTRKWWFHWIESAKQDSGAYCNSIAGPKSFLNAYYVFYHEHRKSNRITF